MEENKESKDIKETLKNEADELSDKELDEVAGGYLKPTESIQLLDPVVPMV